MPLARHDLLNSSLKFIKYISTHMPLARHDENAERDVFLTIISTHMPLARHDWQVLPTEVLPMHFYSHASCEAWHLRIYINAMDDNFYSHASCEAWPKHLHFHQLNLVFLLTCLLRGMTFQCRNHSRDIYHFYSHASCEAWPALFQYL